MAKKYIQDKIATNVSGSTEIVAGEIAQVVAQIVEAEGPRFENEPIPLFSNIPATGIAKEEDGSEAEIDHWYISQDESGALGFEISDFAADAFTTNQIAIVAVWKDEATATVPQAEGEPLKSLQAVYVLALPTVQALRNSPKLREYMDSLIARDTLQKARTIARKMATGADGFTLVIDPVGMFLAATASAASRESAYNRMWTFLQAYMLQVADKTVTALKARGDHGNAGMVKATFSRQRLNKVTLKACLSSQGAAAHYFPSMVNKNAEIGPEGMQWDSLLKMLITRAPEHKVRKLVKDADGNKVLDAEGKATYETVAAPQSPAIFSYWLENRYTETDAPAQEEVAIDFGSVDL